MATPAYAFSLPSLEDDLPLDCRVYHPPNLSSLVFNEGHDRPGVKGAVVAHPYAPLGGCYDDPVVLSVTETLVERGYIVGTFNFRGAGDSQGRTSWTGKAEQEDYTSMTGFMIYYLHRLMSAQGSETSEPFSPMGYRHHEVPDKETANKKPPLIELLLAGYSYGSLILARLPAPTAMIEQFESAERGTTGAEILLRAHTLAKQTRRLVNPPQTPTKPRGRRPRSLDVSPARHRPGAPPSPITLGGEETDPAARRKSRDAKRSVDIIRRSVEVPRRIRAQVRQHSRSQAREEKTTTTTTTTTTMTTTTTPPKDADVDTPVPRSTTTPSCSTSKDGRPTVKPRYLVVSPVLTPFTHSLLPPGSPANVLNFRKKTTDARAAAGAQFHAHPTLAVFGAADVFTSSRRLRAWAEGLAKESPACFEWEEVDGAGHFWHEAGVMRALRLRLETWCAGEDFSRMPRGG